MPLRIARKSAPPTNNNIDSGMDIQAFLQGGPEKSSEIHSPHQDNMDFHPDIRAFLRGGSEKSSEKGSEKSSEKNGDGGLEPALIGMVGSLG